MKARVSLLQGGSSAMASSRPASVSSPLPASEGSWEGGREEEKGGKEGKGKKESLDITTVTEKQRQREDR